MLVEVDDKYAKMLNVYSQEQGFLDFQDFLNKQTEEIAEAILSSHERIKVDCGSPRKIDAIKAIRVITNKSLRECKDLLDGSNGWVHIEIDGDREPETVIHWLRKHCNPEVYKITSTPIDVAMRKNKYGI